VFPVRCGLNISVLSSKPGHSVRTEDNNLYFRIRPRGTGLTPNVGPVQSKGGRLFSFVVQLSGLVSPVNCYFSKTVR
jgi:hypothetical protein